MSQGFKVVSKAAPCPACGKSDWCAWSPDGLLKCERTATQPPGMFLVKAKDNGGLFTTQERDRANSNGHRNGPVAPRGPHHPPPLPSGTNFDELQARFVAALTPEELGALSQGLQVTSDALRAVGCGWASGDELRRLRASGAGWPENYPEGVFSFPEREGGGRIVGFSFRAKDGRKGAPSKTAGARRGLIVPPSIARAKEPILVVEGASDVAAAEVLGLSAVGRPACSSGADDLARLLVGRETLVVGENDAKEDGGWPGRDGAKSIAGRLASVWEAPVAWTLPPEGSKDIRAYLADRLAGGLDVTDRGACHAAGQELLKQLGEAAQTCAPEAAPKQAELIVRLATEMFRFGVGEGDEPFAVPQEGPNIALMFRGNRGLRPKLAKAYRDQRGRTASATALAEALLVLEGLALEQAPEPVYIRIAPYEGGSVIDIGDSSGTAIVIRPGSWEVVQKSPVLFRRTALTKQMAVPERGGEVGLLRQVLNVREADWPLMLGFLVAAFIYDLPHPILLLGGEQGTGKTTAGRFLVGLFDPSTAEVRSPPSNPDQWAITTAGSWGLVVDNVSHIPEWLSDAMCKACTGDGWLRRRLYSDNEVAVLAFRRVIILTSIDTGALKGDLADRLLQVDLDRIPDGVRRPLREIEAKYAANRPQVMGAILDVVAKVLSLRATVVCDGLPRMADFAVVLKAMDQVLGTNAAELFSQQRGRIAGDVVESDVVGPALVQFMEGRYEWSGSMKELLDAIRLESGARDWPKNAKSLSGRVRRLAPALMAVGLDVIVPRQTDKRREYVIRRTAQTAQPPIETAGPGVASSQAGSEASRMWAIEPGGERDRPPDRPAQSTSQELPEADCGRLGGSGGCSAPTSLRGSEAGSPCRMHDREHWWRIVGQRGWTCGACHPPETLEPVEWASSTP